MVGQVTPSLTFDYQAFFTKTLEHLLKQGRPAIYSEKRWCAYRTPEGLKCAFGVHIEDTEYSPKMESQSVYELHKNYPKIFDRLDISMLDLGFVADLQSMHDVESRGDNWREALERRARRIAKDYDLTLPAFVWSEI